MILLVGSRNYPLRVPRTINLSRRSRIPPYVSRAQVLSTYQGLVMMGWAFRKYWIRGIISKKTLMSTCHQLLNLWTFQKNITLQLLYIVVFIFELWIFYSRSLILLGLCLVLDNFFSLGQILILKEANQSYCAIKQTCQPVSICSSMLFHSRSPLHKYIRTIILNVI